EVTRAYATVAVGAALIGAGVLGRVPPVAHVGGVITTLGIWQILDLEDVSFLEAYLAPVAAQLWAAGFTARRRGTTSSWLAYVPAVAIVGVPALVERMDGGSGWHAGIAGAVAVVAVLAGAQRRLGGPLVVGTVLLVAVTLFEAFAAAKNRYVGQLRSGTIDDPTATDRMYARVMETTGGDPLPYGVEPNRAMLDLLVDHAVRQRILTRPVPVESLFAVGTRDLVA
ncbi:MAG: SCO7613 C-terminal domain-containing membrane protein, partial [Egibacteraceae bacterium]